MLELPRRGRRLPAAPRHGQRRPGRAAAPRRSLRPRRDLPQPPPRRPLHRHVRVLRGALLPPRRRPPRPPPGLRTRGHRAAPDRRARRHPVRQGDERGLRLPHAEGRRLRDRPLLGRDGEAPAPRRHLRHPDRARRLHPRLLRRHGHLRRPGGPGPGRGPVPLRGPRSSTARKTSRTCTSTAGRPARPPPARARADWSSHTSRRGPTRPATSPTRRRPTRARWNWPCRARCTRSEYAYDETPASRRKRGSRRTGCEVRATWPRPSAARPAPRPTPGPGSGG